MRDVALRPMIIQSKHPYFRTAIGIGFSAFFMYMALRQVNWREAFNVVTQSDVTLICLGLLFAVLTYLLFALRWRVLLMESDSLPISTTFAYIMIGYLANTVLPLRLGDVTRAALLGRKRHISGSLVLGSIVLERLLDICVILVLALSLSLVVVFIPLVRYSIMMFAGAALGALAMLLILTRYEERLMSLTPRLPSFIPRQLVAYLIGWVTRFAQGTQALRHRRQLVTAIGLSWLAWISAGCWSICHVAAFHLATPWYAGLFVLVVVNLGAAIPSSPGAIGVYHSLAMLALSVWVADKNATAAYALVTHAINIMLIVALGSLSLWLESVNLASLHS